MVPLTPLLSPLEMSQKARFTPPVTSVTCPQTMQLVIATTADPATRRPSPVFVVPKKDPQFVTIVQFSNEAEPPFIYTPCAYRGSPPSLRSHPLRAMSVLRINIVEFSKARPPP